MNESAKLKLVLLENILKKVPLENILKIIFIILLY